MGNSAKRKIRPSRGKSSATPTSEDLDGKLLRQSQRIDKLERDLSWLIEQMRSVPDAEPFPRGDGPEVPDAVPEGDPRLGDEDPL